MLYTFLALLFIYIIIKLIIEVKYKKLETEVLEILGFSSWEVISYFDAEIIVKSRQALEKYDDIKYFKDNREELASAKRIMQKNAKLHRF